MQAKTYADEEADPGIAICYSPDGVIHAALQHHLTPAAVLQPGVDATASAELFKSYVHRIIASTPIDEEDNCVVESVVGQRRNYFPHLFHRMSQDMFYSVVKRLQRVFVTDASPVARWSLAVSAPPTPPLAKIVRVGGGALLHPLPPLIHLYMALALHYCHQRKLSVSIYTLEGITSCCSS